ncbi:hypothetical protein TEA_005596 [Camellia sinensis var. sinensis]|uniref:Uncharacterized protein n=1 Tax=Camellia sinensis var. sinensis TaxID=542762 RepID=A0A4S4EHU0_CAMSN|nr:hypothetical protein TEA_005596 [Camellia sinensis var. sinensis]
MVHCKIHRPLLPPSAVSASHLPHDRDLRGLSKIHRKNPISVDRHQEIDHGSNLKSIARSTYLHRSSSPIIVKTVVGTVFVVMMLLLPALSDSWSHFSSNMKFGSKKVWKLKVPFRLKGKSATRFCIFPKVKKASYGPGNTPVYLNVYDLTHMNGYVYWAGFGIFHSGVEDLQKVKRRSIVPSNGLLAFTIQVNGQVKAKFLVTYWLDNYLSNFAFDREKMKRKKGGQRERDTIPCLVRGMREWKRKEEERAVWPQKVWMDELKE